MDIPILISIKSSKIPAFIIHAIAKAIIPLVPTIYINMFLRIYLTPSLLEMMHILKNAAQAKNNPVLCLVRMPKELRIESNTVVLTSIIFFEAEVKHKYTIARQNSSISVL